MSLTIFSLHKNNSTCRCRGCNNICAYFPCHLLKRSKLFLVDKIELRNKVVEMLVAGVDVRLGPDAHDSVEVVDVDVDKHAVQSGQDLLTLGLERLGEGDVCGDREQLEILQNINKYGLLNIAEIYIFIIDL